MSILKLIFLTFSPYCTQKISKSKDFILNEYFIFPGHSNSVARLVDNELPISTLNSPVEESLSPGDYDEDHTLGHMNNLNGSYSNLFRDKCDENDEQEHTVLNKSTMSTDRPVDRAVSENLYSNIPQINNNNNNVSAATTTTTATTCSDSEKSDPNQHVYSNVMTTSVSQSQSITNDSPILDPASSTLLSDDLDLDDPVIVAGSFGQTATTNAKSGKSMADVTHTGSGQNDATDSSKPNVGVDRKSLIPQVTVIGGSGTADTALNSSSNGTSTAKSMANVSNNNAFCSPSRMRLLHDTTMIDTALDLDSLDGSSIGNSSQACLVKTAIV